MPFDDRLTEIVFSHTRCSIEVMSIGDGNFDDENSTCSNFDIGDNASFSVLLNAGMTSSYMTTISLVMFFAIAGISANMFRVADYLGKQGLLSH